MHLQKYFNLAVCALSKDLNIHDHVNGYAYIILRYSINFAIDYISSTKPTIISYSKMKHDTRSELGVTTSITVNKATKQQISRKCGKCEPPNFAELEPPRREATLGVTNSKEPASFAGLKKTLNISCYYK